MKIQLTQEQNAAVCAPVGDNLVSAAAGSGKTKVLSERITKKLRSGDTSIDRLLIVTFTRAAASQMRERIRQGLEEEYRVRKTKRLKRQLSLLASADICTIDSFCIDLVRRNFFRVDVPPDFTVADEGEMVILREEAVNEVLEEEYLQENEDFLMLSHSLGKGKNDQELKEMILKVYSFTRAFPSPEDWLKNAIEAHTAGSEKNNLLFDELGREIKDRLGDLYAIIKDALLHAENYSIDSYAQVFREECTTFKKCFDKNIEDFGDAFDDFAFGSFVGKKVDASLAYEKERLKNAHDEAKGFYEKIRDLYEFYKGPRGISREKINALVRCVEKFSEKYMKEKLLRKELEFSDCEYLALKALESSDEAVEELRKKYDEIYIDEYQDTNHLQDTLFTMISREEWGKPNLFIVGDVKQSIYRFRHSDPGLFAHKGKAFENMDNGRKMILSKNFRSREDVINSVNSVFEKIMRQGTGGVNYDEEHRLKCGAKFVEYNKNKSEIYVISNNDIEEGEEELLNEEKEALVAANLIKDMMDSGFMVAGKRGMRKLTYSDVAVLSPSIKGKADMITGIFNLLDIPVLCEASENFFDTLEIRTVISLLRCVDNPLCDIPLASVMRSPVFSFGENELAEIRLDGRGKPFYENVVNKAREEGVLGLKCSEFIQKLSKWRDMAYVTTVERFVTDILDESGYYSFVGALPGGAARQRNLRTFITFAGSFEKTQFKGLYNFIRYVDKTLEMGGDMEVSSLGESNCVLVTTIHKSKGLEFPVVIVIGCGKKFNDRDACANLLVNPEFGMALAERDPARRIKYKTGEYKALSNIITRESHAEQQRLLYVAMTRAKEKLILIGSVRDGEKKALQWEKYDDKPMSDFHIRSITNYLDYVLSGIDKNFWDVHFVDALPEICEKPQNEEKEEGQFKIIEDVIYKLSYTYPFDGIENIPSKMSVSEIKKMSMDEEAVEYYASLEEKRIPSFMKGETHLTGANRGTAYHRVMELISLNETDVKGAISSFVEKGLMSKAEGECIDPKKVEEFLNSPLAHVMRRAKKVWKEEPFTISVDAKSLFVHGEEEKIMVQGTIDCLIEDEKGKIILLDYKTDFYNDPKEVGEKYKKQLELYELAVFARFGQKCDKKCLYLFHNGDIIEV